MAPRAPWLSLRTSSFVTERYPPIHSFGSLLQQQQLLVHFALGIGRALRSSLGGGRSAEALAGQRKSALCRLFQGQLLLLGGTGGPLLVRHFADRQAETNGLPRTEFSADAMQFLSRLPYPGNIRELKNLVERTILVSGKPTLDASDFDAQYIRHNDQKAAESTSFIGMTLDEIERQTILQALERHKGNLSQVAMALGISRAALYRRLEKHNINYTL